MSAFGCCGEWNEHAPNCITTRYQKAQEEIYKLNRDLRDKSLDYLALDSLNSDLRSELEKLKYNYSLREKEIQDNIDNSDESKWVYWRKMYSTERDECIELKSKVNEIVKEIQWMIVKDFGSGLINPNNLIEAIRAKFGDGK